MPRISQGVTADELRRRMQHFEEACRAAGVKLTPQRLEVFREVARSTDHPDAETVLAGVRARIPSMSLDTVYRTLWMLTELNLVGTLGPARARTRFDANLTRHHHFVCTRCGLTRDFESPVLDALPVPEAAAAFGEVEATQVEVRGVCTRWAKRRA